MHEATEQPSHTGVGEHREPLPLEHRISKDLSAERKEAANRLKAAAHALSGTVSNPDTRPLEVHRRELEQAKEVLERKQRIGEVFQAFLERAVSAYEQTGARSPSLIVSQARNSLRPSGR
jgi:hypothetical protein